MNTFLYYEIANSAHLNAIKIIVSNQDNHEIKYIVLFNSSESFFSFPHNHNYLKKFKPR